MACRNFTNVEQQKNVKQREKDREHKRKGTQYRHILKCVFK